MSERERMFDARSITDILKKGFGAVASNDHLRAEKVAYEVMEKLQHRGWKTPEEAGDASGDAMHAVGDKWVREQTTGFVKRSIEYRPGTCLWCGDEVPGRYASRQWSSVKGHWCSAKCVDEARAFAGLPVPSSHSATSDPSARYEHRRCDGWLRHAPHEWTLDRGYDVAGQADTTTYWCTGRSSPNAVQEDDDRPADDASDEAAADAARIAVGDEKFIAWCTVHRDLAWLYQDGSVGCMHCYVVESGHGECEAVPLKLREPADKSSDDPFPNIADAKAELRRFLFPGTRIERSWVISRYEAGEPIDDVAHDFGLDPAMVRHELCLDRPAHKAGEDA